MVLAMSVIHQTRPKVATQPTEKATFVVTTVSVTSSCEAEDDAQGGVRAQALAKAQDRIQRRTAHLRKPPPTGSTSVSRVADVEPDPEIEAATRLPPPEDTRAILQIWRARRAASADSADKQ